MVHQRCPATNHRMPHRLPALPKRTNQPSDPHRPPALSGEPTNHRDPHCPPVLPKRTNQPSDAASSTSAAQADQPTIGCRIVYQRCPSEPTNHRMQHRPPASPKQIQIKSPRKRPAHSHRGGMGDSTLHSRNSLAFACRRLSANSVSLHARTVCSSLSQLQPARSCIPALGSERSFS